MGYGPATGPTLKIALGHTCQVVGKMTNTEIDGSIDDSHIIQMVAVFTIEITTETS